MHSKPRMHPTLLEWTIRNNARLLALRLSNTYGLRHAYNRKFQASRQAHGAHKKAKALRQLPVLRQTSKSNGIQLRAQHESTRKHVVLCKAVATEAEGAHS